MIAGLISSYDEGMLVADAVDSLAGACDRIGLFEGPVGDNGAPLVPWNPDMVVDRLGQHQDYLHMATQRKYADAAGKRNACIAWARSVGATWAVWLDADEVMLWPQYLRSMILRAEMEADEETAIGGFPIRVVELDGSVALGNNRIVSMAAVKEYLHDAYQARLVNDMVVALPNEKVCGPGGIPYGAYPMQQMADGTIVPIADTEDERVQAFLARHRPPVAGEPHILHRAVLRDPNRQAARLNAVEAEWFPPVPGQ